jgi:TolB protein
LGKIVFTCQVFRDSQRNQICLMGADGSAQARMTWEDQVDHVFPSLAPDGLSFVYAANPTGRYQIYEMDLLGAQHLVLSLEGDAFAPEISSDGAPLVFTYKSDDRQTIWVANRDGSDPHPVENPDLGQGWDPSWSPDGSRILFASDRAGDVQLFIIGADGAGLTQITQLQDLRGRNAWSPDGLSLATYAGDSWTREVILMGTDGADPHPVTSGGNNLAPSFSPDGAWIAYTSYRDRYQDDNGCEIYIQRLADGTTQRLTDNDYCDWQPRWGR